MNKVLTSPSSMGQVARTPFDILNEHGYEVINNPYGRKLTEDEVITLAADCVGIVAGVEPLTRRVMEALPHLRCISRVGVGMDNVDVACAKSRGIAVRNTPDGPTLGVAELTLGLTMSLLRRIPQADAAIKAGRWEKQIGSTLKDKTVGIVGLGRIGKMVAGFFRSLGNPVIGCDLYADTDWAGKLGVRLASFDEVLREADILTLHVPPLPGGKPLVAAPELAKMKKGACLINTARGSLVDEAAVCAALRDGTLSGAAFDVFTSEPYKGPLAALDNVVLTPHIASYAAEVKLQMEIDAVNNLVEALKP
jgi:D-3-phosphoglycerate dehydrogenase / 2-oxoglutarate reductase